MIASKNVCVSHKWFTYLPHYSAHEHWLKRHTKYIIVHEDSLSNREPIFVYFFVFLFGRRHIVEEKNAFQLNDFNAKWRKFNSIRSDMTNAIIDIFFNHFSFLISVFFAILTWIIRIEKWLVSIRHIFVHEIFNKNCIERL